MGTDSTRTPVLVLGRDGMGADATEEDYGRWVEHVGDRIDERCGFSVCIEGRLRRDVQSDVVTHATDEQEQIILEAKQSLWEEWCAAGAP